MRLDALLAGLLPPGALPPGAGGMDISCLTDRADRAGPGSLFVCIRGYRTDGHTLAPQAWAQGCRAFLVERPPDLPAGAAVIRVADTRAALSLAACRFYGEPSRALRVVGVTGTKGKTTTACLLRHILARSGIPCGYIGTNGIEWGETRTETRNTTPDPLTLQQALHDMLRAGCRAAVLAVSSQALEQRRADGTRLAAAVSNAGGLGTINMTTYATPEAFQAAIRELKSLTDKPFSVNLSLLPDTKPDGPIKGFLQAVVEEKVKIVETAGSSPAPLMDTLKGAGCLVMHKIPDSRFAHTAQEVGCDAVCIVGAMLAGRAVRGVASALIFSPGAYTLEAWVTTSFVTSITGIVLQLAVVVPIVVSLERAGLVPPRYPQQ